MPNNEFFREYDLVKARKGGQTNDPAPHQSKALEALWNWYWAKSKDPKGGILVLPTGGGKTFTATHFLCRGPLSDGYKVLWLAHTHHLLEQAFYGFENLVGLVAEPRDSLSARVVSGTIGHFPVHTIKPQDDVVIASLPTACNAALNGHAKLEGFLKAAKGKLVVVFDEAHHSPAPSYRKLLDYLRQRCPQMFLLGLTATPTYSDDKKQGWLLKLFPQGIVYQVEPRQLMAAGVLSRPVLEESATEFTPEFDEREYQKWLGSNRDLPDDIVTRLAEAKERNDKIVAQYVQNRKKYGRTIIFADRWYQCEYIREALRKRGIKADAVYSHVYSDYSGAEARNRRTSDENAKVLQQFRQGKLEVLLNVRMLTEGTDVPQVQTVFLTRQTTSQILLTQMIGRALRGPKFGGTDKAYIVSFIDDWKQRINWAGYDQLSVGIVDPGDREYGKQPPVRLISIDLVRRLAQQMDTGHNVAPAPYRSFLPLGWYRVDFYTQVQGSEDIEPTSRLVLVYEGEKPAFEQWMQSLDKRKLSAFQEDTVRLDEVRGTLEGWQRKFFASVDQRVGGGLADDLFAIARHIAQNDQPPRFFAFEERDLHDLDRLAKDYIDRDLGPLSLHTSLEGEYRRTDRMWRVFYPNFALFKSQLDGSMNRILHAMQEGKSPEKHHWRSPEDVPERESGDEIKIQVKNRDGMCLCCGSDHRRHWQVDHIYSYYSGGSNHMDNLQTLCKECNGLKGTKTINFRSNQTSLTTPPAGFPDFEMPPGVQTKDPKRWAMFLRRSINFLYQCAAVESVHIGKRGSSFREWEITLYEGNDPKWLRPHLRVLAKRIRQAREEAGYEPAPERIVVG